MCGDVLYNMNTGANPFPTGTDWIPAGKVLSSKIVINEKCPMKGAQK